MTSGVSKKKKKSQGATPEPKDNWKHFILGYPYVWPEAEKFRITSPRHLCSYGYASHRYRRVRYTEVVSHFLGLFDQTLCRLSLCSWLLYPLVQSSSHRPLFWAPSPALLWLPLNLVEEKRMKYSTRRPIEHPQGAGLIPQHPTDWTQRHESAVLKLWSRMSGYVMNLRAAWGYVRSCLKQTTK